MRIIGLLAPLRPLGIRKTLNALSELLNVRFEDRSIGEDHGIDAWLLPDIDLETLERFENCSCPCFATVRSDHHVRRELTLPIEFSCHQFLPSILAGRTFTPDEADASNSLPRTSKDVKVLASQAGAPLWVARETQGTFHHYVSQAIPELHEGEALFQYFHGRRFMQLLPLFLFLKALAEESNWEMPIMKACFMLDDPNLHWRTYGYVHYEELAKHAKTNGYHVSYAMIPMDTWYIHKPTALLFEKYKDQMSLLIHGNDHVTQELSKPYSDRKLSNNLRQAIKRIEKFENRCGLDVSRVMAPPHGACSERNLREMANLGFEGATISRGSLRHYNSGASWLRTLGMRPCDNISGLPVFPRFPLSGNCYNSILIAALLHQPIIPMGHHHDVADGAHHLGAVAKYVNSLGTVHWTDMKGIFRSHYSRNYDGVTLRIRMLSRRIEVNVPEGTTMLQVERPWLQHREILPLAWKRLNDDAEWKLQHPDQPISVLPGQTIEIWGEMPPASGIDVKSDRAVHLWPVLRRQLTEARDRMAPWMRNVSAFTIHRDNI